MRGNNQPVAIVESEKTALMASVRMPEYIWLAAGSINNLNPQKCKVLQGRRVTLFPDAGAYDKWVAVSRHIGHCNVSRLLEDKHFSSEDGADIADYL
ncbi:MAG: hypothetical protein JST82_04885 [Bacteroidetes bacterium]|nr:hypothetical protein [Bacteroidota bacterium]